MADTWKPGRRLAPLCLAALVTLTSQVGAVAAGAIEWRPETLSAIGRTAAALPTVEQRITVTPSGGLRIQLLELSPAQSRAGLRPLLAPVVDGCGVRWLVRLEVAIQLACGCSIIAGCEGAHLAPLANCKGHR